MPDRAKDCGVPVLAAERERRVAWDRPHADEDEHAGEHEDDQGGPDLAQEEAAHDRRLLASLLLEARELDADQSVAEQLHAADLRRLCVTVDGVVEVDDRPVFRGLRKGGVE